MSTSSPVTYDESAFFHILRDKRKMWKPADLAEALGISVPMIYQLLDARELEEHNFGKHKKGFRPLKTSAEGDLFGATPERRSGTRITRRSVLRYLHESADYDLTAQEWADYLVRLLPDLPSDVIKVVRAKAAQIAALRNLS